MEQLRIPTRVFTNVKARAKIDLGFVREFVNSTKRFKNYIALDVATSLAIHLMLQATANRYRLFREFWDNYDDYLTINDNNQSFASQQVFREQGWQTSVDAFIDHHTCNILYGAHFKFVDSCAFNLVVPSGQKCKRIVNKRIAIRVGQTYLDENFSIEPAFQRNRFWNECNDWYTRFFYATSASWNNKFPTNLATIIRWLRAGNNLIVFPTGVFGNASWQGGIGTFVFDYLSQPNKYAKPLNLVALKNEFGFESKTLRVRMIETIKANELARLFSADGQLINQRENFTKILESRYSKKLQAYPNG